MILRGLIYIVGRRKLQNELIGTCLQKETGAKCMLGEDIFDVRFQDNTTRNATPNLVIWDCEEKDGESVLVTLRSWGIKKSSQDYLALLNVCRGLGIEEKCVWRGVRGFFYYDDSLPQFIKGVEAILKGQLWLSREIVTKCILENQGGDNLSHEGSAILTPREEEILAQVAVAATNVEIADKLCVSPHTVKTHLYNIYKKINVPNRLQASLWAAKHL